MSVMMMAIQSKEQGFMGIMLLLHDQNRDWNPHLTTLLVNIHSSNLGSVNLAPMILQTTFLKPTDKNTQADQPDRITWHLFQGH